MELFWRKQFVLRLAVVVGVFVDKSNGTLMKYRGMMSKLAS